MAIRSWRFSVTAALALLATVGCKQDVSSTEPPPSTLKTPDAPPEPKAETAGPLADPTAAETETPDKEPLPEHIAKAVAHPDRPSKDRERDEGRKPGDILAFAGVEPGMTVIDLMSGTGYYAELLAHAVGPDGKVIVQNSPWVLERFAEKPLTERLAKDSLKNAQRLDAKLDELELEPDSIDLALMVLFYHDTFWMDVDRASMNKRVFKALKPGGVFVVIDHHAAPNSREEAVKTLHRGDADLIKSEVLSAGFELIADSEILRHPEDDRQRNVFEPELRGKTDRFVFKFRKIKK